MFKTKWLFNSKGIPVAFIQYGNAFSPRGDYIGHLIRNEIYNGYYKGEFVDDRIFVNKSKQYRLVLNGSLVGIRVMPKRPQSIEPIKLPLGLEDINTMLGIHE